MSAAAAPASEILDYLQQAASLWVNLHLNMADFEFATKRQGLTNYVIDANVVGFFMRPKSEASHISVFASSEERADLPSTAMITAEFMFSRHLAGQGNRPALITPGHAVDLVAMIAQLRKQPSEELEDPSDDMKRELGTIVERFLQHPNQPDAIIDQLKNVVPKIGKFMHEGSGAEATHLCRLRDEDLLCPLEFHPDATRDVLEIRSATNSRVQFWEKRLREANLRLPERERRSPESLTRDAESLVQVMTLDEASKEGENTRWVLITADRLLYRAYAQWYAAMTAAERGRHHFVLRLPLQYVPILNVREMPNGIERSEAVARIRAVLDGLLTSLVVIDAGAEEPILPLLRFTVDDGETLANVRRRMAEAGEANLRDKRAELRRLWQELLRGAVVLNFELMVQRQRAEVVRIAALLRSNTDLRMAIHAHQLRILGEVEAAHLAFSAEINLSRLTRPDRTHPNSVSRRAPLVLRAHFPAITGDDDLETALGKLAQHDRDLTTKVAQALRKDAQFETFFVAACIAHRCGLWSAAFHYANRALAWVDKSSDPVILRAEALYLRASATRYAMPDEAAVIQAFDDLDWLIGLAQGADDALGRLRATCELISLILVVLYFDRVRAPRRATRAAAPGCQRAEAYVERFNELLGDAIQGIKDPSIPPAAAAILDSQLWSNVLAADVLVNVLPGDRGIDQTLKPMAPGIKRVEQAERALQNELGRAEATPILVAERIMSQWHRGTLKRQAAREHIQALRDRLTPDDLELDRAEFERFAEVLRPARTKALTPA